MIRFIYIGDQICDGASEFAFFNTVNDKFMTFAGEQVFSNVKDFIEHAKNDEHYERCVTVMLATMKVKQDA